MNEDEIRSAVLAAIGAIAPEADLQRLRPDQPLRQQIDLDSMDWLNVIAGLHEQLSVDLPPSDYERLATLDSIVAYVASRQAQDGSASSPAATEASVELPCRYHVLRDTRILVRPIRPDDLPLEAEFVQHLSRDNRYQRFMVTVSELPQAKLHYLTEVDQVRHVALAATVERDGQPVLIGVVRYIVDATGTGCEFAIAVDDAWQGTGLAGILMQTLIDVARARGLATMQGIVLATNTRMLRFVRRLGFAQQRDPDDRETVRIVYTL